MNILLLYVAIGLLAGIFSGLLGIGGATIIIPILVLGLGFSQHTAQGTTLALMIPPIGLLAALSYYKSGSVNIKAAAFICMGFFIGGLIGASGANIIPDHALRRVFAIFLVAVGVKMFF